MNDINNIQDQKNIIIKRVIWLSIAIDIIILDQLSKWFITENILRPQIVNSGKSLGIFEWYASTPEIMPYISMKITSFFNLVMAWNTGVSFSMFSNSGEYTPYILIVLALVITAFFTIWLFRAKDNIHGICYAFIIGGALGNVIDRARFGAVIDFLDFHIMGYHWPAFNVADMAIVSGVSLLIIVSLFFKSE